MSVPTASRKNQFSPYYFAFGVISLLITITTGMILMNKVSMLQHEYSTIATISSKSTEYNDYQKEILHNKLVDHANKTQKYKRLCGDYAIYNFIIGVTGLIAIIRSIIKGNYFVNNMMVGFTVFIFLIGIPIILLECFALSLTKTGVH